jgi:agarase
MAAQVVRTRWGGIADPRIAPSGFFRTAQIDGIWWLVDPDGGRFLSKGVDTVRHDQDCIQNTTRAPYAEACGVKYGSIDAWRSAAAQRLLSWGFNSLGAWSDEAVGQAAPAPLALTPNLDLGAEFAWRRYSETGEAFPDVFDPEFEIEMLVRARELCAPRREDASIIGYFTDNELRWGPDWRGSDELLTLFLRLRPASAGREAGIEVLRQRYGEFAGFNEVWRTSAGSWDELSRLANVTAPFERKPTYQRNQAAERQSDAADPRRAAFTADCDAFVAMLAERYFAATSAAIRAADPNHIVLGCRFAYVPEPAVVAAAARCVDVISFNCYELEPAVALEAYAAVAKPCLIGEFSFRADDAGLPNTIGAAPRVPAQADRARCFTHYVSTALRHPTLVGYHWFEHADQPVEGRFDGENSNYGTVTIRDQVYEELTRTMTEVNAKAEEMHGIAARLAA